ncbi:MAG TPA: hypothetical protein V6D47_11905, partial [Oscillatoriaceae cyanobacterium]
LVLEPTFVQALHDEVDRLSEEYLDAPLALDWARLVPNAQVHGPFLRGARHVRSRQNALCVIACLQRLSRRFPELRVYCSGAYDLPMTQLVGGEFELFGDAYASALAQLHTHASA